MSVIPLYHRIFVTLREQILNGEFDHRTPLPSEKKLCDEYDVSRATIRKSLNLLEEEGLIERRQGAPTYARALGYRGVQLRGNLDILGRKGGHGELLPGEVSHQYAVIKPDKETWRQFEKQDELGRVVRVREVDGRPYCFVVTYMPLNIADQIDWAGLGDTPVITAVVVAGYSFVKTEQVISAVTADDESATALGVPVGSPLLRVSGLFVDAEEKAVMRKDGYFRPESFEYRMTLYNKPAADR
jgi:GntR family transcriptional regulator